MSRRQIEILHVDDEPDFADLTGTFLEREDDRFTVETATSAEEGMETIGDRPPDCVVSDYNMPGMNGLEFLQAVRERYPELPFILFTGKGSEAVASDAISAGVTDYLQKGSGSERYELLANRIQNVVTARRDAEEATRQQDLMERAEVLSATGGWELRVESEDLRLTDGLKRIYGVEPDRDLLLDEVMDFYEPDSQRRIREVIDAALEDGYADADELWLRTAGGERRIVEGNAELVGNDEDGTLLRGAVHDITDRRERRQELSRLQQAIDDVNVPITLADPSQPDRPLVYVNDAFEEITGYPPEETLGRNCRFLQGEETAPEKVATLRDAIADEDPVTVELRNYRKDGTKFWNRLTITPIYDEDGNLVRYLGTQEDVTERKERERELKTERRSIEQALDTLDDLFYVLDPDGSFRRWNDQFQQTTGYTDSELADMRAIELFPEANHETIANAIQRAISGETVTVEADLLTTDGERRPYEFTGTRLTDADGNTTGLVGIGRDLTGRRRRERRFQALVEESTDMISIVDADGVFQYQSPSVERILGYSLGETIGDTAFEYVHPDDRADIVEAFERGIAEPDATPVVEYRARHADGSWRWLEATGNNQLDNPAVEGYVVNSRDITERKEREQELERTRDLLSEMEELAGIGAWEYDPDTGTPTNTAGARRIYGVDAEDSLSLDEAFEFFYQEDREELRAQFEACLDTGEPYEMDARLTTAEGTQRWVTARGKRVDQSGSDKMVRGYIFDITEQKARELELERYERLVENLPVGVFRMTIDGEIVDMNDTLVEIYEAESRARLRKAGAAELYVDDADRDDLLDRLRRTGRLENELLEVETLDGNRRFVRTTLALNEEGKTTYLEGVIQDVTDRRKVEREFAQIKTIAESLNDAVYVIDEQGQFTYVNSEFVELTGYSEETVLESDPGLIKDKETVREAEQQLGRLLSDAGPDNVAFETTIQPKNGEPVVCEDHMGVLPYEGDSFNGSVGILRDISERKRRERELRRERDRLDEFASVVSHDLRNPLNVAQGNLELLDSERDTDKIERIKRAHTRMNDLIDDLLTLARQGEAVSDMQLVSLEEIAEAAWRTIENPHASLHIETDRTVQCDPSRLQQLLENLYRNAVEHGGSEVTVTIEEVNDGFYVEDTGPGIPEDERERVFESGYSTATDGTGFGLRIVEQVIEAHGWHVAVTEGEQGGARFDITGVELDHR